MKLNPAIFLALGFAVSAASPLYAADSSSNQQGQSGMSTGMAHDMAQKNYQEALDNCKKKTGVAKSKCMKSAAEDKCKDLTGAAKSACMKDATGKHPGSSDDASGMKRHQDEGRTGTPGGGSMEGPADGSSGQAVSPNDSYK
ncbi:hypothetical protein [Thiobacillus sp.]|uniref:hypothetical protein n=1 Tax=Thiobacillus sp. TaxID=924 RepID=UPI00178E6A3A|nr:hypothetical protein [Thiobacillus sp.]MBC2730523.1 hypothetical protein [Thiobacillus sp.]MBC2739260.1 hypothetical protein [Thiobacillus sp.]MBC2760455.1 hypothetical protein [Thiobacillus sp.]